MDNSSRDLSHTVSPALDLERLEGFAHAWITHRAEFMALSDEEKASCGVPKFWHDARALHDALSPEAVIALISRAKLAQCEGSRDTLPPSPMTDKLL